MTYNLASYARKALSTFFLHISISAELKLLINWSSGLSVISKNFSNFFFRIKIKSPEKK